LIVKPSEKYDQFLVAKFEKARAGAVFKKLLELPRLPLEDYAAEERPISAEEIERYADELSSALGVEVKPNEAIRMNFLTSERFAVADEKYKGGFIAGVATKEYKALFVSAYRNLMYFRPYALPAVAKLAEAFGEDVRLELVEVKSPEVPDEPLQLRPYQLEAVSVLERTNWNSAVQIPTGGGKTRIGVEIIRRLGVPTIIAAPTKELLNQWMKDELLPAKFPKSDIGFLTGEKKELGKPILLATYSSLYKHSKALRAYRYKLLVLDEFHRTSAKTFALGVSSIPSTYVVGLTATYWRNERTNNTVLMKFAPLVFVVSYDELVKSSYLAKAELVIYEVPMGERTVEALKRAAVSRIKAFESGKLRPQALVNSLAQRFYSEASKCEEKLDTAVELVRKHKGEKIIVFTEYVSLAEKLAERLKKEGFKVFVLVGKMSKEARRKSFEGFREASEGVLVTAKVGDEGINIPDASVGIIVAANATTRLRTFIQRIGRLVRKAEGKEKATIYVLVCDPREAEDEIAEFLEERLEFGPSDCAEIGQSEACGEFLKKSLISTLIKKLRRDLRMERSVEEYAKESEELELTHIER